MSTLHFIDHQRSFHPVQQLCQVLGVVPSRYYASRYPLSYLGYIVGNLKIVRVPVPVTKGVDAVLPRIIMGRVVKRGCQPNHQIFFAFNNKRATRPDVGVVPMRIVFEAYVFQCGQVGREEKWGIRGVIQGHSNPGGN